MNSINIPKDKKVSRRDAADRNQIITFLHERFCHLLLKEGVTNFDEKKNAENLLYQLLLLTYPRHQSSSITLAEVESQLEITIGKLQQEFPGLIGDPHERTPIVMFPPFIAFRRSFQQLKDIVKLVRRPLLTNENLKSTASALSKIDWQLAKDVSLNDEQRLAAYTIARLPFCLVTGGAGTGKTTTLAKALELIFLKNSQTQIFLAAPTGKAAYRLSESLKEQIDRAHPSISSLMSRLEVTTIHRLLAVSENTGKAYRNVNQPLICDVLVVDEASMIDTELFHQIQQALLPEASLILLGDANQLPPINGFSVFNELSSLSKNYTKEFSDDIKNHLGIDVLADKSDVKVTLKNDSSDVLANAICRLSKTHRFGEKSLVEQCADATLKNNARHLITVLENYFYNTDEKNGTAHFYHHIRDSYPTDKKLLLQALPHRIILCANRQHDLGSSSLNRYLDVIFRRIITGDATQYSWGDSNSWYEGRRILIEKNHYNLGLFNGDIGECYLHENQWHVSFDGQRSVRASDLPADYSLAFAITIHKSQGSEYNHVDIVLGAQSDDLLSDEGLCLITPALIYTAITRAKKSLTLSASESLLKKALGPDSTSTVNESLTADENRTASASDSYSQHNNNSSLLSLIYTPDE